MDENHNHAEDAGPPTTDTVLHYTDPNFNILLKSFKSIHYNGLQVSQTRDFVIVAMRAGKSLIQYS
jgi:hypothetical protein